jgi:hypothetical protein
MRHIHLCCEDELGSIEALYVENDGLALYHEMGGEPWPALTTS